MPIYDSRYDVMWPDFGERDDELPPWEFRIPPTVARPDPEWS